MHAWRLSVPGKDIVMAVSAPLGISDFRKLRQSSATYVDKSAAIAAVLRYPAQVMLLARPRRFGKTLLLSTLQAFVERGNDDREALFGDLAIWNDPAARQHLGRYPVIAMTFKDVKHSSWDECLESLSGVVARAFDAHRDVRAALDGTEAERFDTVLERRADKVRLMESLAFLSKVVHRHHGEQVVLLIDDYDRPIQASHVHGYYDRAIELFHNLLSGGLKDNAHLFKGVLTGILRVSMASTFSGLNNLSVFSLLHPAFGSAFGFTEAEVSDLLERAGLAARREEVQRWYNGYVFGRTVVYNPWSVLSFLANAPYDMAPQPYWVSTSANELIQELLVRHAERMQPELEALLAGQRVERAVDENVVFPELARRPNAVWSLLVFSGYLKAEEHAPPSALGPATYALSIPNLEVRQVYAGTFQVWMKERVRADGGDVERLTRALLAGDVEAFEMQLQAFATHVLSYHDTGLPDPEKLYHGFILGLLAVLEPHYVVRSNRESGAGRPDVQIRPAAPGKPGVLLELKVAYPGRSTLEDALARGIAQISRNGYAAELRVAGAQPIHALAVAFDGKTVRVQAAPPG
jgi:hypothetical protein